MKRILWFALRFFALTAPLTWLWVNGGREVFASHVFVPLAGAIYDLLGLEVRAVWRERYIHFVPFVALVLLTPGLGARRRTLGVLGGLLAMFLADVVINGVAQHGHRRPVDLSMPLKVLSDALPFAAWAVVAHAFIRKLARGADPAASAAVAPASSAARDAGPAARSPRE